MTFDMKVRFDTGRKLAMSVGSRPDFLRRGVTIACFCDAGSRPYMSDVLTSVVRNGSSRSTDSRTRNIGTGSSMHDLTGDCIMMRRTSVCLQDLNDASDDDAVPISVAAAARRLPIARHGPFYRRTRRSCPQYGLCCQPRCT